MRYVITGGPGFGKTSIVQYLKKQGFPTVNESSRKLINELKEKEGEDPRNNRERFQKLIVERRIKDYAENNQDIVFFDRGVYDEAAYSVFYGNEPTAECRDFCKKYKYDKVFIVPPWKEIHIHDELRKESFEDAVKIHNLIIKSYKETGHEIIELPKINVEQRAAFILSKVISKIL